VGTIVGGLGTIPGPLLGGIAAFFLPILSQQWVPAQTWIPATVASAIEKAGPAVSYGALLIAIMIFAPNGGVGLIRAGYGIVESRLRAAGDRGTGQAPPDAQTV
jgi:ABC-type branched-subunit amino acid transport system permease subunit